MLAEIPWRSSPAFDSNEERGLHGRSWRASENWPASSSLKRIHQSAISCELDSEAWVPCEERQPVEARAILIALAEGIKGGSKAFQEYEISIGVRAQVAE